MTVFCLPLAVLLLQSLTFRLGYEVRFSTTGLMAALPIVRLVVAYSGHSQLQRVSAGVTPILSVKTEFFFLSMLPPFQTA